MPNVNDKRKEIVIDANDRLRGLKTHSQELNSLVLESLQKALLILLNSKPYEKISITELCRVAGVSRMAFYGNFETKDDVLSMIVIELNRELEDRIGSPFRKTTTYKWYYDFFTLVDEKKDILKLIFDAGFQNRYLDLLNKIVLHDPETPIAKKYQRLLWSGGIENAIVYWLTNGMKESVEEIATYCCENLVPWSY